MKRQPPRNFLLFFFSPLENNENVRAPKLKSLSSRKLQLLSPGVFFFSSCAFYVRILEDANFIARYSRRQLNFIFRHKKKDNFLLSLYTNDSFVFFFGASAFFFTSEEEKFDKRFSPTANLYTFFFFSAEIRIPDTLIGG